MGAVEQLVSGDDWREALAFAARFRSRSFNNTMLIWVQHQVAFEAGRVPEPFPTLVAGYRQWQALGRQVMKGQPGYMIFAPVTGRFATATPSDSGSWRRLGPREKPKPGEVVRSRMVGARPAYVWDVSQTDGEPLPTTPAPVLLEGEAPAGLWDGLAAQIRAAGFEVVSVPDEMAIMGANGMTDYESRTVGTGEHVGGRTGEDAGARTRACTDARPRRRGGAAASRHPRGRSRVGRADDRCRARHDHRRLHDPVCLNLGRTRRRQRARADRAGHRRTGAEDGAGDPRSTRHSTARRRHPSRPRTRYPDREADPRGGSAGGARSAPCCTGVGGTGAVMPDPFDVLAELIHVDRAPDLTAAARSLAAAGVPVFPCEPDGKRPLTRRGFIDATSDLAQVAKWWSRTPEANIGLPTGAASGVVAVDVDVHGPVDGRVAWRRASAAGLVDGAGLLVRTPTGGAHAYFPATSGTEQRSWQAASAGVDFRGDGGYIIAPPSRR
ncbi:MAG TPA: bifunctional DNA primase/polymerase, partial [Arachnia sp.]|nr:bifunctional DNA primase/polymerase [Arachnia sp.]